MNLDVFTVFVFLGAMCFLAGSVMFMAWWVTKSSRGLLLWSISFFIRTSAFPLLILRGKIHDFISIDIANTFLMLGLGISWYGSRELVGQKARVSIALAPAIVWLLACRIPEFYQNTESRVLFFAIVSGAYSALIGADFLISGFKSNTRGARMRRALGGIFIAIGLMYVLRSFAVLYAGVADNPMQGGNLVGIALFITLVWVAVGTVIWLAIYFEEYVLSLKHDAEHDAVTNCPNRRALMLRGQQILSGGGHGAAGVLVFDLDYFKQVNDTYGHYAGDQVLRQFAQLVGENLRGIDVFGRLGGEEFAAVLPGLTPLRMEEIAGQLRQKVEEHLFELPDATVRITTSIGMVHSSVGGHDLESLLMKADDALYQAKDKGRNRIVLWQSAGNRPLLGGYSRQTDGDVKASTGD